MLTHSCASLLVWPDGQELERGQIQELVSSKFRKRYADGPLAMGTAYEKICLPLDICQGPIGNRADKKVHFVDVRIFPQQPQGLLSGLLNGLATVPSGGLGKGLIRKSHQF